MAFSVSSSYSKLRCIVEAASNDALPAPSSILRAIDSLTNSLPFTGLGEEATEAHLLSDITPGFNGPKTSPNYYGFVTGGVLPIAELADNIVTAFDQNVQVHLPDQSISTIVEDRALKMLVELLHLGEGWDGKTFTTGATSANILGLACGREFVISRRLTAAGEDRGAGELGLLAACSKAGVKEIQVLTTMAHSSLYKAASIIGIGRASVKDIPFSEAEPWRIDLDLLQKELDQEKDGIVSIVVLSAGEVNTGRFATDGLLKMKRIRDLCDQYGAWLHVDGAFGIFARSLPQTSEFESLISSAAGLELANSVAGDGHKMLNVVGVKFLSFRDLPAHISQPYDCGFFFTRSSTILSSVFQNPNAAYLSSGPSDIPSPLNIGLENSRRFRALPVYAVLLAYGREGIAQMFARQVRLARGIATFLEAHVEYELLAQERPPSEGNSTGSLPAVENIHIIVIFRAKVDAINERLVKEINATRQIYVSGTKWGGIPACRIAVRLPEVAVLHLETRPILQHIRLLSESFHLRDLIAVGQLAWTVYKSCRDAPESFGKISLEVSSLYAVLEHVKETFSGHQLSETERNRLRIITDGCNDVLRDLQSLIDKYQTLGTKSKRTWDRMRWNSECISELRARISSNVGMLQTLISSSQFTVEKTLCRFLHDLQVGRHESTILTAESLSTGEKESWRNIRKELDDIGITLAAFNANKSFILNWFKQAIISGALEERIDGDDSGSTSTEIPQYLEMRESDKDSVDRSTISSFNIAVDMERPSSRSLTPGSLNFNSERNSIDSRSHSLILSDDQFDGDALLGSSISIVSTIAPSEHPSDDRFLLACEQGNVEEAQKLLDNGAGINATTGTGYTAIMLALKRGNSKVLKWLLEKGASVEPGDISKAIGNYHVHQPAGACKVSNERTDVICCHVYLPLVAYMVEHGAGLTVQEALGLFTSAIEHRRPDLARLLAVTPRALEARTKLGLTPLQQAAKLSLEAEVRFLLDLGADTEAESIAGLTALDYAILNNDMRIVLLLLEQGRQYEYLEKGSPATCLASHMARTRRAHPLDNHYQPEDPIIGLLNLYEDNSNAPEANLQYLHSIGQAEREVDGVVDSQDHLTPFEIFISTDYLFPWLFGAESGIFHLVPTISSGTCQNSEVIVYSNTCCYYFIIIIYNTFYNFSGRYTPSITPAEKGVNAAQLGPLACNLNYYEGVFLLASHDISLPGILLNINPPEDEFPHVADKVLVYRVQGTTTTQYAQFLFFSLVLFKMFSLSPLLLLTLLLLSSALSSPSPFPRSTSSSTATNSTCQKTSVAILGAGLSGIIAAQTLSNLSLPDFLILEHNPTIGGRVAHTTFGLSPSGTPYVVELGANWVQGLGTPDSGGPENPIWTLAKKWGLHNTYSNYSSIETFDETGAVDFSANLDTFEDAYAGVEEQAGVILVEDLQDVSMRTGLGVSGWKPKKDMRMQAAEWWEFDWEYAYSPDLSSETWAVINYNTTFYQYSEENNYVYDQRGFNHFIIGEASTFLTPNDPRLLLSTTVSSIDYSSPTSVTIHTTSGSCVEARYAICTFSLGVLQNDIVSFTPPFPAWKQQAIDSMQMGTYTKIFLQFPPADIFWNESTQFFLYADPVTRGWYPVFQSLDTPGFLPGSGILFVTVVHEQSYRVEAQSSEATQAEIMNVLRSMHGPDIPEPTHFMYPRWSLEPWAMGSYSNWPGGWTLEGHQNLRANLGRLFWAGEAYSAEYFGFLQGAYFEGRKAAVAVAGCLRAGGGDGNGNGNGNGTVCGETHYEELRGTTGEAQLTEVNGWDVNSFLDYGF
ncbi:hypothetical protein B7494_g8527 [Chlorociboria aeruginascens]|nr:hypothetical protein B7494_g8527 [Chlorociboria aeruginascens]